MGWNSRMDEIQAAILNIKIKKLDFNNKRRKEIGKIYNQNLNIKMNSDEEPKIRAMVVLDVIGKPPEHPHDGRV